MLIRRIDIINRYLAKYLKFDIKQVLPLIARELQTHAQAAR